MPTIYSFLKDDKKNKKIFINSIKNFFDLALKLMKDDSYFYRGINTNNQKYPKIIREKDLSKIEIKFLQEFEKYYGLYSKTPNFWEFLALAQHHGLKTRLIDFSNNIFVATFFSLHRKSIHGEYKVFVFDRKVFMNSSEWNKNLAYVSEPDDKMSDNAMIAFKYFESCGTDSILTPNYSNNRIFVQQGLFVIPGVLTIKHIDKLYDNASIEITISSRIRKYILDRLKSFGYDEYRLMPDLDSACEEINNSFIDEKS